MLVEVEAGKMDTESEILVVLAVRVVISLGVKVE